VIPFGDAIQETFQRLGLGEPGVMLELTAEWARLAGEPWASKATPLYIRSGTLVVEATDPGAVAFLKYGAGELERRLRERFSPETLARVEIRPPQRPAGRPR
jgi:hypothetical protein